MTPNIGIPKKHLVKSISILEKALADEMVLYVKTRKFHWNVAGENFMELHQLFQEQYTELEEIIDVIAERINKLGGKTIGTMKEFSDATRLKETPGEYPVQMDMIALLLNDHEALIKHVRKDIGLTDVKSNDIGTIDFLTGILEQHETIAWVLRRYLS